MNQGLNPAPPDLTELMAHSFPAEAFWMILHGVRMTGIAAFCPIPEDTELWTLVSFLQRMRGVTLQVYEAIMAEATDQAPAADGHGHRHGYGPHDDPSHGQNRDGTRKPDGEAPGSDPGSTMVEHGQHEHHH